MEKQLEQRRRFFHSGQPYLLEVRRRPENRLVLSGVIRNRSGARCAEFQNAYTPGDACGLPARIQYRPRPFLRLTFEEQPEGGEPPIPWLFEESA